MMAFGPPANYSIWTGAERGDLELAPPFLAYTGLTPGRRPALRRALRRQTPAHTTNKSFTHISERLALFAAN